MNDSTLDTDARTEYVCKYGLECFKMTYILYHGYISVFICFFGIIANVLNIVVLTRKEMISPTNAILTGLATSDMLVMIAFIVYSIHYYVPPNRPDEYIFTYEWAIFTLIYSHFSVIFHGISIWQTVVLAIWRYIAVSFPSKNIEWCNMYRAKIAILSVYAISPIITLPNYLAFEVAPMNIELVHPIGNQTHVIGYNVKFSELALQNNRLLAKMCLWMFSILTKLVPSLVLILLSYALIKALSETKKRRMVLKNRSSDDEGSGPDRVTAMLLAVLLIFLITELPGGILALLLGIQGDEFEHTVYRNLGEVIDILAVINSAVNFILYCTMSRLFRDTFSKLFKPRFKKWQWISMNTQNPLPMADIKNARISVTYNTSCV